MPTDLEVVTKARNLIRRRKHWVQGAWTRYPVDELWRGRPAYCAVGAINAATYLLKGKVDTAVKLTLRLDAVAMRLYGGPKGYGDVSIVQVNDGDIGHTELSDDPALCHRRVMRCYSALIKELTPPAPPVITPEDAQVFETTVSSEKQQAVVALV